MPYADSSVFRSCNYYGKFRMKAYCRNIVCVAFERLDTAFSLIIPNLLNYPQNFIIITPVQTQHSDKLIISMVADLGSVIIRTSN